MNNFDVLIIGGGIVGASIARELSRYQLDVGLIEKNEECAFGVSKSNSGIIHPGTQMDPNTLKAKLCVLGNRLTRKIASELGVDFKEVGELIIARDAKERNALLSIQKIAQQLGVPRIQLVDKKWLKENEPNLSEDIIAALYVPTAGIISPYRMVYDLVENAQKNGVTLFLSTKVESIEYDHERSKFNVFSARHSFSSSYVINAAGLYADDVARMLGIQDINIRPRKGEEYILDKKQQYLTNHLIFPLPQKNTKGILVIKTSDGNPMIGPTAKDVNDKEDVSTTEEGLHEVLQAVKKIIPSIQKKDIIAYFAGLRPVAGNDFIIRSERDYDRCITVAGIQSPGLTAAPAIALMVCDLIKGQGLKLIRKKNFHRYRKKTEHLFDLTYDEAHRLIKKDASFGNIVCRCEMVSEKEIKDAIKRGAKTLDGIKFRTRAQAGRCHGGFCTARIMKILAQETNVSIQDITKRGEGSEIIVNERK